MATSTFDKSFIVNKPEDQERFWSVVYSDQPALQIKRPLYSQADMDRSEEQLRQFFSRSSE